MSESDALNRKSRQGPAFWITTAAGLILIVVAFSVIDLKSLHQRAEDLNGVLVFLIVAIAPLLGFPVSVAYVLAGAKFGSWGGMGVATLAIVFHLLGSWWIARSWLRRLLNRILDRFKLSIPQIPKGEDVPICLLVALVPGVSYTLKNYMLVLAGARFHPFFWTCLAANTFHASLAVFFGDFTGDLNRSKVIFLVTYGIVLLGLSHYVVHRLKRHRRKKNS
jgi:uncharacterized membrane protein YdjX (TVP38/TMEM64 family)